MNFYINKPKNSIPTLSLVQCDWGSLSSKKNFSQNLGQALHEHGFVLMENNFLPVDLNNQIFNDTADTQINTTIPQCSQKIFKTFI